MMRKKNITLNGKKCEGAERLEEGDVIRLFLADETIAKFFPDHSRSIFRPVCIKSPSGFKNPADVERSAGIRKQHGLLQKDGKGKQRPGSKAGYHL